MKLLKYALPTKVEEACDTKPPVNVPRPINAVLAFKLVVVAPALKSARPPKVERPVLLKLSD